MMDPDEYREAPDLTGKKIDFSQFHAIGDHWPFSAYCRTQYGGGRQHLKMAWEYRWSSELRRWTRCKVGLHNKSQITRMKDGKPHTTHVRCYDCGKRFSDDQPV